MGIECCTVKFRNTEIPKHAIQAKKFETKMIFNPISFYLLLIFLFFQFQPLTLILAFSPPPPSFNSSNYHILQDLLKVIVAGQRWNLESTRVSYFDLGKARFGNARTYEFRIPSGNSYLDIVFSDEVDSWNKFKEGGGNDFEGLVTELSSLAVLDAFKVEGPFELRVDGGHELSLSLPLNISHTGLKRILVGEGITVEVRGAQEVSLFQAFEHGLPMNRTFVTKKKKIEFWPFWHSFCMPLLPIRILGSASLVAYRTRNSDAHIETTSLSMETVELLPEKCYSSHIYKNQVFPIDSSNLRISMLENNLSSFLGGRIRRNGLGFLKAKIEASTIIRFQLELERNISSKETSRGLLAEWRTKPTVERVWFEVKARIEAKKLKPFTVKRVRPFAVADSAAWSSLMSNISFTKFPSILVPSEALTLDVKW